MTQARGFAMWCAQRWRQSLVVSMTIAGMLAVVLVALLASAVVSNQIEQDALARAQATAAILARSTFAPHLPRASEGLTPAAHRELDAQLKAARASQPGTEAVLRGRDARILFASTGATDSSPKIPATGTSVAGHGDTKRVRSVLPVRTGSSGPAAAYLELEVPYAPVAHDIQVRTRRLNVLLALAGLALYLLMLPTLIRAGRAVRAQYDPRRVELARKVKRAIGRGELSLAFQPIVDSGSRELRSVEALVRWTDPREGPISPGNFIPALETTPAMWDLSEHIFELAFRQCEIWCEHDHRIRVAVNVSGAVLLDKRLIPTLQRLAREHRVPPTMIELEITEGALVQDPSAAAKVLERIAAIGLSVIAIDDFGTGYSSLARLHELPLNTLKIDQSFVMRMARDGNPAVVRSVIELAHALNMDVIAEGVEDEDTAASLHELGAEYLQGYYLSRPLPSAEVISWLEYGEPASV